MEELDHDFMWRCHKCLPERGRIGIFNRSYYEEVLVVRVHPELLGRQKLPPELVTRGIWKERLDDIAGFERYLARQGTTVLKFFLHVSRKEQKRRFLERLDQPEKNWKFSTADIGERAYWDEYMAAYEGAIRGTARGKPRGTWSRPTTSGSPVSWSRRRSSRRSGSSTPRIRRSTTPGKRNSPPRGVAVAGKTIAPGRHPPAASARRVTVPFPSVHQRNVAAPLDTPRSASRATTAPFRSGNPSGSAQERRREVAQVRLVPHEGRFFDVSGFVEQEAKSTEIKPLRELSATRTGPS